MVACNALIAKMIWTRVTWGHKCVYSSCNKKPQKDPTSVLKIAASFSGLQHASRFDSFFSLSLLCVFPTSLCGKEFVSKLNGNWLCGSLVLFELPVRIITL